MSEMTFQKFVEATYAVANDLDGEDYIPTYVDPLINEFLVLEGVPDDVSMQVAAREWARSIGSKDYFLGYQSSQDIVLEYYLDGEVSETVRVEISNSRIQ